MGPNLPQRQAESLERKNRTWHSRLAEGTLGGHVSPRGDCCHRALGMIYFSKVWEWQRETRSYRSRPMPAHDMSLPLGRQTPFCECPWRAFWWGGTMCSPVKGSAGSLVLNQKHLWGGSSRRRSCYQPPYGQWAVWKWSYKQSECEMLMLAVRQRKAFRPTTSFTGRQTKSR